MRRSKYLFPIVFLLVIFATFAVVESSTGNIVTIEVKVGRSIEIEDDTIKVTIRANEVITKFITIKNHSSEDVDVDITSFITPETDELDVEFDTPITVPSDSTIEYGITLKAHNDIMEGEHIITIGVKPSS